jgi:hypothetical protein
VKEGYRMKKDEEGVVMMEAPDESEQGIDLNWRRLRNMAQPIVDEQLGRLAMNKNWRDTLMKLNLGVFYVDTSVVRIDEALYSEMNPNGNATDMDEIERAWKATVSTERASMVKARQMPGKKQKSNKFTNICGSTYGSFCSARKEEEKEKEIKIVGKKKGVEVSDPVIKFKSVADTSGEEEEDGCMECCEAPCMWLSKREEILDFDDDINGHLPREDWPPNNVHRRKVYHQMALHINEGGTGKGVCMKLPKCVGIGVRECFSLPTFMGFMSK